MKRILAVALMFAMLITSGCGNKYSDETLMVDYALWVEDKENVPDMLDAINTHDKEFLAQQVIDGKVKHADKETKIAVTDEFDYGKIVEIKFLQGRYKNKVGYTLSEFIIDVGKERELEKKRDAERKAAEEKKLADEKARLEKEQADENARLEQLKNFLAQNNAQIACTMAQGTDAYQKLIGTTNLPEGTRLKITLAGVKKEATVQQDGTFSALFERSIIPVGEQNVSISTLDKEIYIGKIDVQ